MFSILNRALFWAITGFGNKFCLKKRSRLIKALDNRFYVKLMQLEIGLFGQFSVGESNLSGKLERSREKATNLMGLIWMLFHLCP